MEDKNRYIELAKHCIGLDRKKAIYKTWKEILSAIP